MTPKPRRKPRGIGAIVLAVGKPWLQIGSHIYLRATVGPKMPRAK